MVDTYGPRHFPSDGDTVGPRPVLCERTPHLTPGVNLPAGTRAHEVTEQSRRPRLSRGCQYSRFTIICSRQLIGLNELIFVFYLNKYLWLHAAASCCSARSLAIGAPGCWRPGAFWHRRDLRATGGRPASPVSHVVPVSLCLAALSPFPRKLYSVPGSLQFWGGLRRKRA